MQSNPKSVEARDPANLGALRSTNLRERDLQLVPWATCR